MNDPLETLNQYHFDRDEFCKVFYEFFTNDQIIDIDVECSGGRNTDDFSMFRYEDEFYILHRNSGVLINWYKHLGRTNTCNKPDFTLDDLRVFCKKLKEDLVWDGVIKDPVLFDELLYEFYKDIEYPDLKGEENGTY